MDAVIALWGSLGRLGQSLVVAGLIIGLYAAFRRFALRRLEALAASTENDLDDRLMHFFRRFAGLMVTFVLVFVLMKINGWEISPLLAGAGIVGVALGFAAKETIADVLAGVFLIADRPLRVGDRVKIEHIGRHWGGWGDVLDIGLRRTVIRNTDGVAVNYPNAVLANSVITNFSHDRTPIRVRIRFQVDHRADLEVVRRLAEVALEGVEGAVPGSAAVVLRAIWDDAQGNMQPGVLLEMRYRIEDVRKRTAIRSEVLDRLLAGMLREGVPLPASRLQLRAPDAPDA